MVLERRAGAATLRDVAEVAGVSASTASRVLNRGARAVSDELSTRVLAVADALGYVGNQAARALRGLRSGVVLLAEDPRTASIAAMAAGMEQAGREHDVTVSITAVGQDPSDHISALRVLRGMRPLALVVTSASFAASDRELILTELRSVRRDGANVVFIGEHDYDFPAVRFDDQEVGRMVGRHMASLGRSRPAILTSHGHPAMESRARGFLDAFAEAGYDVERIAIENSDVSRAGGRDATRRLLERSRRPDVILAGNDVLAIGALHALNEAGLATPRDVALSGVDDIPIACDLTPPLTTVALPFLEAGRAALALALSSADEPDVHLRGRLIVRASTLAA